MNEIKPCPFCGGEPRLNRRSRMTIKGEKMRGTCVSCTSCKARGTIALYRDFDTPKQAESYVMVMWNRRESDA